MPNAQRPPPCLVEGRCDGPRDKVSAVINMLIELLIGREDLEVSPRMPMGSVLSRSEMSEHGPH